MTIRIDTTQVLLGYDGDAIVVQKEIAPGVLAEDIDADGNPKHFTFRNAVFQVLNNALPGEDQAAMSPETKANLFRVTCLVATEDKCELSPADEKLIRERAGAIANVLVYGRICEILDTAEKVQANREARALTAQAKDERPPADAVMAAPRSFRTRVAERPRRSGRR